MTRVRYAEVALGAVVSAVVIALGARFALSAGGLWRDEVSTFNLATRPTYPDVLAALHFDSAPALYPTILRAWIAVFTGDDPAMRALGFVLAVAAVAVLWIGARTLGVRVPLLALTLFAAQGVVVQTVSVVKPYGLGTVLAIAAFCAISALAARPGWPTFATATLLAVASAQTAYQNVALIVPVAAVAAGVAWLRDRRAAALVAIAGALALLSVLPYAPLLMRSQDWRPLVQQEIPARWVFDALARAFTGRSVVVGVVWLAATALALHAAGRELAAIRRDPASRDGRSLYAVLVALVAIAAFVPFLILSGRPPLTWHCVHVLAVVALTLDLALSGGVPAVRWARVGLAAVALAVIVPAAIGHVGLRQTNVDRIARHLTPTVDRGDLVVVNPWWLGLTFARYYRGDAPFLTLPAIADLTVHRYDLLKARMVSTEPLADLHGAIVERLQRGRRVWLVGSFQPFFVSPGQRPPVLPPAPGAPSGWLDHPYADAWAMQTGFLVQTSALTWRLVPVPDDGLVQPLERVGAIVVEGWRGDVAAISPSPRP